MLFDSGARSGSFLHDEGNTLDVRLRPEMMQISRITSANSAALLLLLLRPGSFGALSSDGEDLWRLALVGWVAGMVDYKFATMGRPGVALVGQEKRRKVAEKRAKQGGFNTSLH